MSLYLLCFVLLRVLDLLRIREFPPHSSDDLPDLPELEVRVVAPHVVPDPPGVPHVGEEGLLRGLGRLGDAMVGLKERPKGLFLFLGPEIIDWTMERKYE